MKEVSIFFLEINILHIFNQSKGTQGRLKIVHKIVGVGNFWYLTIRFKTILDFESNFNSMCA